jgi:hypothetical protein
MKRQYAILLGIAAALILGLFIFISLHSSGTLELTMPAKTPGSAHVNVEIQPTNGDTQKFDLAQGRVKSIRLKVGTVRVNTSVGDIHSVDVVAIKSMATTKLTAPQGKQLSVQQVGSNAGFCPVQAGSQVYSYDCNGEGPITKHGAVGTGNSFLFDGDSFAHVQPIKGGLIGMKSHDSTSLTFINLGDESIQDIPVSADIAAYMQALPPQILVANHGSGQAFALSFSQKNLIYLFQYVGDPNPKTIKLDKSLKLGEAGRTYSVTFASNHIVVYVGASPGDEGEGKPGIPQKSKTVKTLPCYLITYDLTGKQLSKQNVQSFVGFQQVYELSNGFYAAKREDDSIMFYHNNGKTIEEVYSMQDVGSWTLFKGAPYLQVNGVLYQFIPKQGGFFSLQSRFHARDYTVSELFDTTAGLMFTAYAGTSSDAALNIYLLGTSPQKGSQPNIPSAALNYIGFEQFLTFSLGDDQVNLIKNNFASYIKKEGIHTIGVTVSSVVPGDHDPDNPDPIDYMTFDVALEGTVQGTIKLKGRVEYNNLTAIHLFIYNSNGDIIYDSNNP